MYTQSVSHSQSARSRLVAAPICSPPRPVPRRYKTPNKTTLERARERAKESRRTSYPSSAEAMKEGVGRKIGCSSSPAPGSSASCLLSSSISPRSRSSHSDASLCVFLSQGLGPASPRPRWRGSPRSAGCSTRRRRNPGSCTGLSFSLSHCPPACRAPTGFDCNSRSSPAGGRNMLPCVKVKPLAGVRLL